MKWIFRILVTAIIFGLALFAYNERQVNDQYEIEREGFYQSINSLEDSVQSIGLEKDLLLKEVNQMGIVIKNLQALKFKNDENTENSVTDLISTSDSNRLKYFGSWTIKD